MQPANPPKSRFYIISLAVFCVLAGASLPSRGVRAALHASLPFAAEKTSFAMAKPSKGIAQPSQKPSEKPSEASLTNGLTNKEENLSGEFIGPITDCDGDGVENESNIDFNNDGIADECVEGREELPEPPFEQSYTPTLAAFYSRLPAVGWQARYQCGDGLYDVTLSRPSESQLLYSSEGLQLTSNVVYDDLDPNLNQPLIVQDPIAGIRYNFKHKNNGEFYEYAIADYGGDVGLYVYQTGEQIVAAPCELAVN
jgi:hypothetical protein